ncbi:MAG: lipoprotein-releasing system transmembrane subunit LolC [Alphaproteobacteria bacterium]|nr:lipoprotein-releasing system transmembrane subunit LolC [Alphaproteobacteria bacterium]
MLSFFELWVSFKFLFPKTKEKFFSIITFISFAGISLGVATLIIVMSVMNGFRDELTSKILGVNGHLKIKTFNNLKIEKHKQLKLEIQENINNVKVHKVIVGQGLLNYRSYSSGTIMKGVETDYFTDRKIFNEKIANKTLSSFKKKEGVIVGEKLREKLNLKIGDNINIISPDNIETILGSIPRSANFKIVGFFSIGMYEYDSSLIFVPISLMQKFLNLNKKIDFLEIYTNNFSEINSLKEKIYKFIPDYFKIIDWRELNPTLFNALEVERNVMFLILLLIILVAAFNLISSMIILVSTKSRDIGVLRTLGVGKRQLLKIFIINGFFIGLCGTILGLIIGVTFCLNINEIKQAIEFFLNFELFSEEIYFFTKLPVILDFGQIMNIIIISLTLSFLATIYPSIKASRVEPINLIKWD